MKRFAPQFKILIAGLALPLIFAAVPAFADEIRVSVGNEDPSSNAVARARPGTVIPLTADYYENGLPMKLDQRIFTWKVVCDGAGAANCPSSQNFVQSGQRTDFYLPENAPASFHFQVSAPPDDQLPMLPVKVRVENADSVTGKSGRGSGSSYGDDDDYYGSSGYRGRSKKSDSDGSSSASSSGSKSRGGWGGSGGSGGGSGSSSRGRGDFGSKWKSKYSDDSFFGGGGSGGGGKINTKARGFNHDNSTPVMYCYSEVKKGGSTTDINCIDAEKEAELVAKIKAKKEKAEMLAKAAKVKAAEKKKLAALKKKAKKVAVKVANPKGKKTAANPGKKGRAQSRAEDEKEARRRKASVN